MAVNPRAANVGTVTHPVTLPTRSLALGQERAAQVVLATVTLLAWGIAFGATPSGARGARRDRGSPGRSARRSCATVASTTARWLYVSSVMPRPPRSSRLWWSPPLPFWTRAPSLSGSSPPPCSASSRSPAGTCASTACGRPSARCAVLGLGAGEEADAARARLRRARGPRRRARRLRRQPLARGRPGAGRARRAPRGRPPPRHRRHRPDRQPSPSAAARAPARSSTARRRCSS